MEGQEATDDHQIEYIEPLSPDLADDFEDGVTNEELASHDLPPLPKGWVAFKDEDQDSFYYYNAETDETIWDHPSLPPPPQDAAADAPPLPPPPQGETEATADHRDATADADLEEEYEDALTTEELEELNVEPLPPGWVAFHADEDAEDIEGRDNIYFFHAATATTMWHHPSEIPADKMQEIKEEAKQVDDLEKAAGLEKTKQGYVDLIKQLEDRLGPDNERTLTAKVDLADLLKGQGELGEARDLLENVYAGRMMYLGHDHKDTLDATRKLADVMVAQGDAKGAADLLEKAEKFHEDATPTSSEMAADGTPDTADAVPPAPIALGVGLSGLGREESKGQDGYDEGDLGAEVEGEVKEEGESDIEEDMGEPLDPEDFYGSDEEDRDEDEDEDAVIAGCMCVPVMKNKPKKSKLLRRNYVAADGTIKFEMVKELHNPHDELLVVAKYDKDVQTLKAGEVVYLIDLKWLTSWIFFASRGDRTPPPINNTRLVGRKTGKVKKAAKYNKDYRPINGNTWRYLHKLYKGGPTIKFKVPEGINLSDAEEIYTFINASNMKRMAEVVQKTRLPTELERNSDAQYMKEWRDVEAS